jgi:protoporphyrinogen oxidase
LNTPVEKIIFNGPSVREIRYKNSRVKLKDDDLVISTIPIPSFVNLCRGLSNSVKEKLKKIEYAGNVCLCMGCKENLTDYYWVNIVGKLPFGTVINHNNMYDDYPWKIIYVSNYVSENDPILRKPDKEILKLYVRYLRKVFKKRINLIWYRVFRTSYAVPIFRIHFLKLIPNNTEFKNLRFAGPFMMFPQDRLMGSSIQSGIESAKL